MYQLIAILAAAFGFLTGAQPSNATLPLRTAALHPVSSADAIPPIGDLAKAPADAIRLSAT